MQTSAGEGAEPGMVAAARRRATKVGFQLSSEVGVGALLAVLAASVPPGGRILELGTGAGVGLAWLVHGLQERDDVEIVTVDVDPDLQQVTRSAGWPPFVRFDIGDGAALLRDGALGRFSLIFADAPGGKLVGLHDAVGALAPGGSFVVDDMDLARHDDPELRVALTEVRAQLLHHPDLVTAELAFSSGVILATKIR